MNRVNGITNRIANWNVVAPPSLPRETKPATLRNRLLFRGRKNRLIYAAETGNLTVVRELIEEYGVDINSVSTAYYMTALMRASLFGNLDIVRYLIDHGANVNATADIGMTALMFASQEGHLEIVRCLVERGGANANAARTSDGCTALMWASMNGHLEVVRYLVERGDANVNAAQTDDGMTALMFACKKGHLEIVRYLCQNSADTTLATSDGRTAIDYAEDPEVKGILLEGCSPTQAPATASAQGGRRRRHKTRNRRNRKYVKQSKRNTRK
jgi:ankyrin repeat protein